MTEETKALLQDGNRRLRSARKANSIPDIMAAHRDIAYAYLKAADEESNMDLKLKHTYAFGRHLRGVR